ncbi:hypothetical protein BDY21DRAFT_372455 [Lineolata rhizophorae]|uniref:Uncharacterized protein n=1 Tax=Lineolata rhizophorae TaxID=578093 RepID=A0A6A6NXS0_9PEZI|nr:hypothetical protein BDY21DRAFT_372455 [Lineolata rhizophorae]
MSSSYGSGTEAGAGFGNKSAPDADPSATNTADTRFDKHTDSRPYTGGSTDYGSGMTDGPGAGNKTGGFASDSRTGKLMEKAGHLMHNENMVEKGRERRRSNGLDEST